MKTPKKGEAPPTSNGHTVFQKRLRYLLDYCPRYRTRKRQARRLGYGREKRECFTEGNRKTPNGLTITILIKLRDKLVKTTKGKLLQKQGSLAHQLKAIRIIQSIIIELRKSIEEIIRKSI